MLLSGVATLSIRAEERHLPTDSLSRQAQRDAAFAEHVTAMVTSRRFIFRPIEMQSIELGTTRDTYAYNFFFSLDEQHAVVHLPFEMVSMVIYTEQFEAIAANYSSAYDGRGASGDCDGRGGDALYRQFGADVMRGCSGATADMGVRDLIFR